MRTPPAPITKGATPRRRLLQAVGVAGVGCLSIGCAPGQAPAAAGAARTAAPGALPPDPVELSGEVEGYNTRLLLLGTAAGGLDEPGRTAMASAVAVGDRYYLVDAGPGANRRFTQAGMSLDSLAAVFITHMHSDHLADLFPIFWMRWWTVRNWRPIPVHGPGPAGGLPTGYAGPVLHRSDPTPGWSAMLAGVIDAYAHEINGRNAEAAPEQRRNLTELIAALDLLPPVTSGATRDNTAPDMEPFPVFEDDRVRVTAVAVPHGPSFPSFAFRFDTDDGSVTFSGDTAHSANVSRLATDTDILVHEVIDADYYARLFGREDVTEHMLEAHTSAPDVGRIATDASARQVVLSHIGPGDPRAVTDSQWEDRVRTTYDGPVVAGRDLTQQGVGARR